MPGKTVRASHARTPGVHPWDYSQEEKNDKISNVYDATFLILVLAYGKISSLMYFTLNYFMEATNIFQLVFDESLEPLMSAEHPILLILLLSSSRFDPSSTVTHKAMKCQVSVSL